MGGWEAKGYDPNLLPAAAALTAYLCHYLQIPVRHARGGVGPGIESHWGLGVAGGHHFDPEAKAGWMDEVFLPLVQAAYAKGDFDPHWIEATELKPCGLTPKAIDPSTVIGLQQQLSALGFQVAADGVSGPETDAAIKAFQTHAHLTADGVAGPETKLAILKALSGG